MKIISTFALEKSKITLVKEGEGYVIIESRKGAGPIFLEGYQTYSGSLEMYKSKIKYIVNEIFNRETGQINVVP